MTASPTRKLWLWVLAALTYLPALTAAPGRMPSDTKLYLYLDPGRLIADAPYTWDTRQFAGWVPHQTIAYLWPSGPWFWVFDRVGVPDWVAHRLWIATLLFVGGLGVRWAARHLGLSVGAASVAGIVYATSPYILPYVSRTSVMLLPWAGVGWLVGLTIRATVRTRWRDVALFGLVVLTIGAVNAAALALIAPAPVLWLVHAAWQRSITWRTAVVTAVKLGSISVLVSLWWIVMLVVQGRHGADVLAFSETLDAVSLTSVSTETIRGLGYWLFYVRDPYAFTTTASADYMGSVKVILAGYALVVVCLIGLAIVRWSSRRYAALLIAVGTILAVGVHPIDNPSPIMSPLADSALGLALRSSTRALPLVTFGMALGAGALVAALPLMTRRRVALRAMAAVMIVALAIIGLPALWTGGYVDTALERDQDVPEAWSSAAAALDGGSTEHRVLQLPGSEFGAFRWGYTVDPPLPGLTDKPLVTRDLLPLGSPGAMDLLYALDNRFQAGTIEPDSIARVARFLGVDTIWLANDLAFDRFRTPRPELIAALFANDVDGLGAVTSYGEPTVNVADIAMLDEQQLSEPAIGSPLPPVQLVPVEAAQPIIRVPSRTVVLAGSGDGIIDAAAAGLLFGDEAVIYAADLPRLAAAGIDVADDTLLIVTDSNRDRAAQWRGSQDVSGMTEVGGPERDALREDVADERLQVFSDPATFENQAEQTVARLDENLVVRASAYGEPFALRPEDRPAMAVDADLATAWRVADRFDPIGESISVSTTNGSLVVVQQQAAGANRRIARVSIAIGDDAPFEVDLDDRSHAAPGQSIDVTVGTPVTITIVAIADVTGPLTDSAGGQTGRDSGPSAVGFAELGPVAIEATRVPTSALSTLTADRPLAITLTRERVRPTDRWRRDPEAAMIRVIDLPVARVVEATITLRLSARASDELIDAISGTSDTATSNRRLVGVPAARAVSALDGDPSSMWTTPFGQAVGSSITIQLGGDPTTRFTLVQPADDQHSAITSLTVATRERIQTVDVPTPDADGRSEVALTNPLANGRVTLTIASIESRTTIDRRYAEPVELPAAISEIEGLSLPRSGPAGVGPPECHLGLVSIDGEPVGVRLGPEATARLAAGDDVDTTTCEPSIALSAGPHRIATSSGLTTGIDVDRMTLRSGLALDLPPVVQPTVTVTRTRATRSATVSSCPSGCWLVLGEGYNPAWAAVIDGDGLDLGKPVQISGGFNGWWLAPDEQARTVVMRWSPQSGLNIALLIAFAAVMACVMMAAFDRRISTTPFPTDEPHLDVVAARDSRRDSAVAGAALMVTAGLVIAPSWAAVAALPAMIVVIIRRPRLLAVAAAASAGLLGLMVAWRQYDRRYFADASWPGHFEDLHRAGLFVVVLLVVGCLGGRPRSPGQDTATASSDPAR